MAAMKELNLEKTSEQLEQELNLVRYQRALNRRKFLEGVGIASLGVASISVLNGCLGGSAIAAPVSQADVLNFALNLEYLEAEFYSIAVTGNRLSSSISGGASVATGGKKVDFGADAQTLEIASEINADETAHVKFLRTALGSAAAPEPAINLDALGLGFNSVQEFLTLARAFEDTGVSAYGGAAPLLSGDNLAAGARIAETETYHASNIRLTIVNKGFTVPKTDSLDQPPTATNFFVRDSNGLSIVRTPSQVLAIVYANPAAGTSSGGFFPSGMNGTIKTV